MFFLHLPRYKTMIGPLWLFLHGMTMGKSSLCMILVSSSEFYLCELAIKRSKSLMINMQIGICYTINFPKSLSL